MKFRKRKATNLPDYSALSTALRTVRDQIRQGDFAGALSELNALLSVGSPDDITRGRILFFVGDSQFQQGKYADAISAYQQAASLVQAHPRYWLRPALGEIISQLKNTQVDDALVQARVVVQRAVQIQTEMGLPTTPPADQTMVEARPWSADAVATRLGKQFLAEGEMAAAQEMFASAQQINPAPTVLTSIALTEVAEREGRFSDAVTFARQALTTGAFQSKTLAA